MGNKVSDKKFESLIDDNEFEKARQLLTTGKVTNKAIESALELPHISDESLIRAMLEQLYHDDKMKAQGLLWYGCVSNIEKFVNLGIKEGCNEIDSKKTFDLAIHDGKFDLGEVLAKRKNQQYDGTCALKILITNKANVNVCYNSEPYYSDTPMKLAVGSNNIDACKLLIESNANLKDIDRLYETAKNNKNKAIQKLLKQYV